MRSDWPRREDLSADWPARFKCSRNRLTRTWGLILCIILTVFSMSPSTVDSHLVQEGSLVPRGAVGEAGVAETRRKVSKMVLEVRGHSNPLRRLSLVASPKKFVKEGCQGRCCGCPGEAGRVFDIPRCCVEGEGRIGKGYRQSIQGKLVR